MLKTQGCYDTIKSKLSYNLQLVSSTFPTLLSNGTTTFDLTLNINNIGWASPVNQRTTYLILNNGSTTYKIPLNADVRSWDTGNHVIQETINLPHSLYEGAWTVSLWMPDSAETLQNNSPYSIRFNDTNMWNANNGYNTLGTLTVASSTTQPSSSFSSSTPNSTSSPSNTASVSTSTQTTPATTNTPIPSTPIATPTTTPAPKSKKNPVWKLTIKKITTKKVKKHHKVRILPHYTVSGAIKVKSAMFLTIKKKKHVVGRHKKSIKLGKGKYKITTQITYSYKYVKIMLMFGARTKLALLPKLLP